MPVEPPTTRQRKSRRALRGLLAKHPNRARVVEVEARELERRRQQWTNRRSVDRAIDVLRSILPSVIANTVKNLGEVEAALIVIGKAIEDARPPAWMRTADDSWLVNALHELDDDELAQILNPARHRSDRDSALKAVRERRRKLTRRR